MTLSTIPNSPPASRPTSCGNNRTVTPQHLWVIESSAPRLLISQLTLQRKNALFTGHDLGAENWATFASLIETCKLVGINPQAYLIDVLARIILRSDADPIDDLLPYNWGKIVAPSRAPSIRPPECRGVGVF